nr:hypothetical protein [Desulfobacterales bacterium]
MNRGKALIFLLCVPLIGGAIAYFSIIWLRKIKELLPHDPEKAVSEFLDFVKPLTGFVVILQLVFAAYLWRLGSRILISGEFPPPGVLLIRSRKVLVGEQARRRGRLCRRFAIVLIAMSIFFPVLVWSRVMAVLSGG